MSSSHNLHTIALIRRYEADIAEAEAKLSLHLSGQIVNIEEQNECVEKITETKLKLNTIMSYFTKDDKIIKS